MVSCADRVGSDTPGEINIDISVNQTNGISAGKIMRHYLDAFPGSRELILVVKAFLQQRSMNEVFSGGLGSYSVICLVLNFLQLHPKIRRSEMNPLNNLGVLLMEFFELYGRSFNYNDVGISLRRGGSYYSKRQRGWANFNNQAWLLSIEDPQDVENDISKTSFGIREVKLVLAGAYDILGGVLADRNQQLKKGQIGHLHPSELTILGSILGEHPKAVKFRSHLKAMYAERRVQRLIGKDLGRLPDDLPDVHPPPPKSRNAKGSKASKAAPEPKRARKARTPSPAGRDEFNAILVDDDSDPEPGAVWESESSGSERAAPRKGKAKAKAQAKARKASESGSEDGEILESQPKGTGLQIKGIASSRLSVSEDEVDFGALAASRADSPEESRYDLGKANGKASKSGSRAGSKAPVSKAASVNGSKAGSRAGSVAGSKAGSKPPSRAGSATPAVPPSPGTSRKVKTSERKAFWAAKAGQAVDEEEEEDYIVLSD